MTVDHRQTFAEDGASVFEDMNAEECSIAAFEARRGLKHPSGSQPQDGPGTEKLDDEFEKF